MYKNPDIIYVFDQARPPLFKGVHAHPRYRAGIYRFIMPRKLRSSQLETRTARLKLPVRGRPFYTAVARGVRLGYRRLGSGAGSWSVDVADGAGGKQLTSLRATADDHEAADGEHVLDFHQAADRARAFARGHERHGVPGTLDEALVGYARELEVRGSDPKNAYRVRVHLTPQLLAMSLGLLSSKVLRRWRDDLLADDMSASTFTRTSKALRSALNLAADHDARLEPMRAEWRKGLAAIRDESEESRPQRRAVSDGSPWAAHGLLRH